MEERKKTQNEEILKAEFTDEENNAIEDTNAKIFFNLRLNSTQ